MTRNEEDCPEERSVKKLKVEQPALDDELKMKIIKQLTYYFSDVNLLNDKFMQEQLEKNDMCVKLSVLATFTRLAQLTKDEDLMVGALQDHKSEVMELDAEKKQIRRTKPLPDKEEFKKQLDLRTVHISGFPDTTSFESLQKYCDQYGEVESLSMRKHFKTKQFKGCIHVVFKDEEIAKKVLAIEDLKFKDRELRRESMEEYHRRKEEIKEKRRKNKRGEPKDNSS